MKSVLLLLLLLLLSAPSLKVCSQPYQVEPGEKCRDEAREYRLDGTNLCCKRCPPGQRLNRECSETSDSDCVDCGPGLYMETWNYNKNCFICSQCKKKKGLEAAQNCSTTTNAQCVCLPGMFCNMDFNDPYCSECRRYRPCRVGQGVSKPGSADSNVMCEPCQNGTFSDTLSTTERCRPHTQCGKSPVVKWGDEASDTVCEHQATTKTPLTRVVHATVSSVSGTNGTNSLSVVPSGPSGSAQPVGPSASGETSAPPVRTMPTTTEAGGELAGAIAGGVAFIFLLIILLLLCSCKRVWRKDSARLQPKVDANGNCEGGDEISRNYVGGSQKTSFAVAFSEQKCLLEKLEASNGQSQRRSQTNTSTRTDGDNSQEYIGPFPSTLPYDSLNSALSEPLTLLSNAESCAAQSSAPTQPSSQPTSPQIMSPVSPSPHVNVNITLNIGNGSCGPPSLGPANLVQADCDLPFGEEEESSCTPQQEDGKQSIMSVPETEICST